MFCIGGLGPTINNTQFFLNRKVLRAISELTTQADIIATNMQMQVFRVVLKQKKNIKAHLITRWTVKAQNNLQILIQLSDQHQKFTLPDSTISVEDVIKQLNSENFLGTYFVNSQQPHLLCFRYKVPLVILRNYLSGTIGQIFEQASQKFTWFVLKIGLIGGSHQIKSSKIHLALVKLQHLKQQFEINRLTRKKAIKDYDLVNSSMKVVDDALKIVAEQHGMIKNFKTGSMNSKKRSRCLTVNKKVNDDVVKYIDQLKSTASQNIACGIEVNGTFCEKKIGQGGFSQIYKGQYLVNFYPTINPKLHNLMNHKHLYPKEQRRILVRKTFKQQRDRSSHENQINLLSFLRNQKHPLISAYFLPAYQRRQECQTEDAPRSIFMEYYQMNFYEASFHWKLLEQRLNASLQMFNGIYFLQQKGLVHRDLKEINMLVDNQNTIKLIDFGSACQVYQEKPTPGSFMAITKELKSTKGYYFPYRQLKGQYPVIAQKYTRQQYEQAESFDVYSAGTILTNLFRLDDQIYDTIYHSHLNFLASKCHQRNPEDRYTAKEALCYIYTINQLYNAVKAFQVSDMKQEKPEPREITLEEQIN